MDAEAAMKRIPPHSIEAEQAVLGAMLMSRDAVMTASEILTGDDFYQKAYGILFDAMVDLFKAGRPVDLITIQEYMKEKDVPPEVSSMEYVRELLADTTTSAVVQLLRHMRISLFNPTGQPSQFNRYGFGRKYCH